jgi:hypothetical protein
MDAIFLAQDRDYWQALFNAVMNHKMLGNFLCGRANVSLSRRVWFHEVSVMALHHN